MKKVQAGEDVYYLSPDRQQVTRVIDDLVQPNGLVGTTDGKTLYVADHGAGKTYVYTINAAGTLSNKKLFTSTGSDGMELDASGNLYLTVPNQVEVFDVNGNHLRDVPTQENPTNVAFAEKMDRPYSLRPEQRSTRCRCPRQLPAHLVSL
jgi:gluconolactonase